MSDEEVEGKGKQVKGKLREAAGDLTGDEKAKAKGRMEQGSKAKAYPRRRYLIACFSYLAT